MDNKEIVYSFMFFDRSIDLFNLGDVQNNWFISFLDTLKSTSQITRNEFKAQRQHYDCHEIPWHKLDIQFNLPWIEQIECLQYRIASSRGRVHGFMIGNHFYVVWLDPWHNLDRDDRFGPRKICFEPLTEYDVLNNNYLSLIEELSEQKKLNEELFDLLAKYENDNDSI